MTAPFIQRLKQNGSTTYRFISASRDLAKLSVESGTKFRFSKFACLKIPNIKTPLNQQNNIQFSTTDGAIFNGTNLSDNGLTFSESFQNYALNLESLLLNRQNYDQTEKRSVSERVFFKWLKEQGAIRFRQATAAESINSSFVEEDNSTTGSQYYDRVVKYIGDINVTDVVEKGGDSYMRINLQLTNSDGGTPYVIFNSIEDTNYFPDMVLTGENEALLGRDINQTHPDGLSISAFYDYDNAITYTGQNEQWFTNPIENSYFTEPISFTSPDNIEIIKNLTDYGLPSGTTEYLRSRLDGITIDFNPNSYTPIFNDVTRNTLAEFNRTDGTDKFEFNCILIYYDIYDVSNPSDFQTNLYSVVFLDNVQTTTSDGGFINLFEKVKFNPIAGLNGNSFGFNHDIKFDSSVDNAGANTIINDYSAYSLSQFSTALNEMRIASESLMTSNIQLLKNISEIDALQDQLDEQADISAINDRLYALEQSFANSNILVSDIQSFNDAVSNLALRIDQIVTGQTPIDIVLNSNALVNGSGISIQNTGSQAVISNTNAGYNYIIQSNSLDVGFGNSLNNIFQKKQLMGLYVETTNAVASTDVIINFNDSQFKWKTGQSLVMIFNGSIDFNTFNLIIKTDKSNIFNLGEYGVNIGVISGSELTGVSSRYEIICLNENTYTFIINKIT